MRSSPPNQYAPICAVLVPCNCLLTIVQNEGKQDETIGPITNESLPIQHPTQGPPLMEVEPTVRCSASKKPYFAEAPSSTLPIAPCKLISRLAANPSADLTQTPVAIDGTYDSDEREGVECSKAYQMLMQYGTTEAKLDTIALALENGCVPNKAPGGGCSVRRDFMWKGLDDLQD